MYRTRGIRFFPFHSAGLESWSTVIQSGLVLWHPSASVERMHFPVAPIHCQGKHS